MRDLSPGLSRAQAWAQAGAQARAQAGPKKSKKYKFSKSKSVSPKMSARSGLAEKQKNSRPHLGPFQAIFCVGRKNLKISKI